MKNTITKLLALVLTFALCFSFAGCFAQQPSGDNGGNGGGTGGGTGGGGNTGVKLSTDVYEGDVIYVGNTAGTTGALATIGAPFNLGINAAFAEFNAAGGFNGKTVALKTYNDEGVATNSVSLLDKLIFEDEVFAIVGHFGSYAVDATLETLKEEAVPMIYAAAGNESLFNDNATSDSDRAIFPVQPLNKTEGRSLILRAFAPAIAGGLGATKVGVIADSNEASQALLAGIKAEAKESGLTNIVYQEVTDGDPTAAINALKDAGCDTVIVTVIGAAWTTAVSKMVDAGCTWKVLTSYNNANAAVFNTESYTTQVGGVDYVVKYMNSTYTQALQTMQIYAQGWINIVDVNGAFVPELAYKYTGALLPFYQALGSAAQAEDGSYYMTGFTEAYWKVAEAIYGYAFANGYDMATAFAMSYDSYALAGYIAGNLFCQALAEMQAQNKELTRANLVQILESKEYQIAMANTISYANNARVGVDAFALTMFFNSSGAAASTSITAGVSSIEELRATLTPAQ